MNPVADPDLLVIRKDKIDYEAARLIYFEESFQTPRGFALSIEQIKFIVDTALGLEGKQ